MIRFAPLLLVAGLAACSFNNQRGTLAELRDVEIDLQEERIEGGLEKAMASYQRFLEETPETAMTPEAIRRLADLKVEKEYGAMAGLSENEPAKPDSAGAPPADLDAPTSTPLRTASKSKPAPGPRADSPGESDEEFEARAASSGAVPSSPSQPMEPLPEGNDDLEKAGALEAIALYKELLAKYPLYERNDQVFYQMSRAYEELGRVEEAMDIMNRMVRDYPESTYMDEVQFRRGEYFFTRKHYLDAEEAYGAIVAAGEVSRYYEIALYKLGWTFYKQELYEQALHKFMAGLDYKVSIGHDFDQTENKTEKKQLDDTFRVISLSFSNLGGAEAVTDYFSRYGARQYESDIYSELGEFYLQKRRYSDAAEAYKAFVDLHPYDEKAPHFSMRVAEIYMEGSFPKLVVEAKKTFANAYGVKADYWQHFDIDEYPDVVGYLKTNLKDLANHYHALYQNKKLEKQKADNYAEALHWYREYLESFPRDEDSPPINYQLADLLLENGSFDQAAGEYERTAYDYAPHEKASEAGYAAVYAYREHFKAVSQGQKMSARQEIVRSSLRFVDAFPDHDKADVVLGAAADDLYAMKNFELAKDTGLKLVNSYPDSEQDVRRSAWIVVAHSSFELTEYEDAENSYANVLQLTAVDHESRPGFIDNLAASIYKQGERANTLENYRTAANHFLRIADVAPTSDIRITAEYDAVAALIQLEDWDKAAGVLESFRQSWPDHELQPEVTKKLAFVYKESGKLALAAAEFENIERESDNPDVRRDALLTAAELYKETNNSDRALDVYLRYLGYFPEPIDLALETRHTVAGMYKERQENDNYRHQLRKIVSINAAAGDARTDRTQYLAAISDLALTEPLFEQFAAIELVQPFEKHLKKKQKRMKAALEAFGDLVEYEVGDVTSAATYYMAEIYYGFSRSLKESERPTGLSPLELEQYELALEDQIYPFEEKAIDVHQKNLELLSRGVYSDWTEKSLSRLAQLIPVRYAKPEAGTGYLESLGTFTYVPFPRTDESPLSADEEAGSGQGEKESADQSPPASDNEEQGQRSATHERDTEGSGITTNLALNP